MSKIYKIGAVKIIDDGNGVFDAKKDKLALKGPDGWKRTSLDSAEMKSTLADMGIGDLQNVQLKKLVTKFNTALDDFKRYRRLISVLTKPVSASYLMEKTASLLNTANEAGIDTSENSVFKTMVLGFVSTIDNPQFEFTRDELMAGFHKVHTTTLSKPTAVHSRQASPEFDAFAMRIIDTIDKAGRIVEEQKESNTDVDSQEPASNEISGSQSMSFFLSF